MEIEPNLATIKVQGKEDAIVKNFQYYINNDKLVPKFNEEYKIKNQENKDIVIPAYSEVTFSYKKGDDTSSGNIKISKGKVHIFFKKRATSLLLRPVLQSIH